MSYKSDLKPEEYLFKAFYYRFVNSRIVFLYRLVEHYFEVLVSEGKEQFKKDKKSLSQMRDIFKDGETKEIIPDEKMMRDIIIRLI
jgi:hypothetical protein